MSSAKADAIDDALHYLTLILDGESDPNERRKIARRLKSRIAKSEKAKQVRFKPPTPSPDAADLPTDPGLPPPPWVIELAKALGRYQARQYLRNIENDH